MLYFLLFFNPTPFVFFKDISCSLCCYLVSWLEQVLCVQDMACKFALPVSVIAQVVYLLNWIWRHHLLSNKGSQNSCPLILDNNHSMFSVICVRFMYKYILCYIFLLFIPTPFVFFKDNIGLICLEVQLEPRRLEQYLSRPCYTPLALLVFLLFFFLQYF